MVGKSDTHKVETTERKLVNTYTNSDQAEAACKAANQEAERLGIKTRYQWGEI